MGASFCWECGKKLTRLNGELNFRMLTPPGGTPVRVHVECAKNYGKEPPEYVGSRVKEVVRKYLGDQANGGGDA